MQFPYEPQIPRAWETIPMLISCEQACPSSPEVLKWAAAYGLLCPAPSARTGTSNYLIDAEIINELLTDFGSSQD